MSHPIVSQLASQWFSEYSRLAYWIARQWCKRLLDYSARRYSADELAELAQDAVCRGYDRFAKRCATDICGQSERRQWVCQCVMRGVRDTIRSKSCFGSITDGVAVRDDAMNRFTRAHAGYVHGHDNEKQDALDQLHYQPVPHAVQQWELEQLAERELPDHLRLTAVYAACGLTQEQSAIIQGVTSRTVRKRLREAREYLAPELSIYAIVCDALRACMNQQDERNNEPAQPLLTESAAQ